MKKRYVKPEIIKVFLATTSILEGSPGSTNDVVTDREALSREFSWNEDWDEEE